MKNLQLLIILVFVFTQTACMPFVQGFKKGLKDGISNSSQSSAAPQQNKRKQIADEFDPKSAGSIVEQETYKLLMAKDFNARMSENYASWSILAFHNL